MATDQKEGRLARWSRLKQEENSIPVASAVETGAVVDGDVATSDEEVPEIRAEDLPDIESLDEHSDFTPFLQKGVPEELSRLALRKLWKSNPVFANLDGLNDYDEDFSIIEAIDAAVDTAYKVGKGFITEEDEAEMVEDVEGVEEGGDDSPADTPDTVEDPSTPAEDKAVADLSTSETVPDLQTKPTPTSDTTG